MRFIIPLLISSLIICCIGCDIQQTGTPCKVEMYNGGIKIREWTTQGHVIRSPSSSYSFMDTNGHSISISGDIVITTLQQCEKE